MATRKVYFWRQEIKIRNLLLLYLQSCNLDPVAIMVDEELSGYKVNGTLFVPIKEDNDAYQAVQLWIAEGNTPE